MRRGALAVVVAVALAVGAATTSAASADSLQAEASFLALTNAARAKAGVPPLSADAALTTVARTWSASMATTRSLAHNPALTAVVTDWKLLAENVGTGASVASIQGAFEKSSEHYTNMVNPEFRVVGIGVVESLGAIWVTLDFKRPLGSSSGASVTAPSRPPSAPAPTSRPRTATPVPAPVRPRAAPTSVNAPPAPQPRRAASLPRLAAVSVPRPATAQSEPPAATVASRAAGLAGRPSPNLAIWVVGMLGPLGGAGAGAVHRYRRRNST